MWGSDTHVHMYIQVPNSSTHDVASRGISEQLCIAWGRLYATLSHLMYSLSIMVQYLNEWYILDYHDSQQNISSRYNVHVIADSNSSSLITRPQGNLYHRHEQQVPYMVDLACVHTQLMAVPPHSTCILYNTYIHCMVAKSFLPSPPSCGHSVRPPARGSSGPEEPWLSPTLQACYQACLQLPPSVWE